MSWGEAILLAVVQGLTEFLPVSSSGHLGLLQHWFAPFREADLSYFILLHLGTLTSLVFYFRADLRQLVVGVLRRPAARRPTGSTLAGREIAYVAYLAAAMIPTAIIGLLLKRTSLAVLSHPAGIGLMLGVTGVLLAIPQLFRPRPVGRHSVRLWQALVIGAVQGVAVIPGISRSGSTIVAGILTGLEDSEAARFSFHLSIPAIIGAAAFEAIGVGDWNEWFSPAEMAGFAAAAITGWLAIAWLLRVVKARRLQLFSYYCLAAALTVLVLSAVSETW